MALRNIFEIFGHFDNLYQHFIIKYDLENTKKIFQNLKDRKYKGHFENCC